MLGLSKYNWILIQSISFSKSKFDSFKLVRYLLSYFGRLHFWSLSWILGDLAWILGDLAWILGDLAWIPEDLA